MKISNELIMNKLIDSSFNTRAIELFYGVAFTIQVGIEGTINGSMYCEVSLDNGLTWTMIPNSTQVLVGPTTHIYNAKGAGYPFIRLVYTHDSGSGNFKIMVNRKS